MKIRKIVVAMGMGLALSGVGQAQAVTVVQLTPGFQPNNSSLQTIDVGPLAVDRAYTGTVSMSGAFEHKWSFDIQTPMWTGGSAMNVSVAPLIGISNFDLRLFDGNNASIPGITCIGNACGGSGVFPIANDYYFLVSGMGTGMLNNMGMYTFTMTTAVPEAETWAMMLAGLGLVGLQLRRRSRMSKEISVN